MKITEHELEVWLNAHSNPEDRAEFEELYQNFIADALIELITLSVAGEMLGADTSELLVTAYMQGAYTYRSVLDKINPAAVVAVDKYLRERTYEHEGNQEAGAQDAPPGDVEPGWYDTAAGGDTETTGD